MPKGIKVKTGSDVDFKVVSFFSPLAGSAFPSLFARENTNFGTKKGEWRLVAEIDEDETRALAAALLKSLEK